MPPARCDVDHVVRYADGGRTHPDNGALRCHPHNQARERPRPPSTRHLARQRTPAEADEWLEMRRRQIRDRVLHDPAWGAA